MTAAAPRVRLPSMLAVATLILLIATALLLPDLIAGKPGGALATTVFATIGGLFFLAELASGEIGRRQAFVELVTSAIMLIVYFAAVYRAYGLNLPVGESDTRFWTGLYFSLVTWTTLGYGDITPPVGIRLVAATEAVLGYVFFGLTVGLVSGMISPAASRPGGRH